MKKAKSVTVREIKFLTGTADAIRLTILAILILVRVKRRCVPLWTKRNTAAVVPKLHVRTVKNVVTWRVKTVRRGTTAAVPITARKRTAKEDVGARG